MYSRPVTSIGVGGDAFFPNYSIMNPGFTYVYTNATYEWCWLVSTTGTYTFTYVLQYSSGTPTNTIVEINESGTAITQAFLPTDPVIASVGSNLKWLCSQIHLTAGRYFKVAAYMSLGPQDTMAYYSLVPYNPS